MDLELLEQFGLEVADLAHGQRIWFEVWHENCGKYLLDDTAQRMSSDLKELAGLALAHLRDCDA